MMNNVTRRQFLTGIAAVGGYTAFHHAMAVLGLMHLPTVAEANILSDVPVSTDIGRGKTVAVIGAGLSGLTAAYELSQRGFDCHIFEADKRPKGRTFTVRPDGSSDSWYQEVGREAETCMFDEADGPGSLAFEAGAGRIPSHHRTVLNYCKRFGVPLESYIFATRSNLVRSHAFRDGQPVQLRRFKHNLRAYLAEMFRTVNVPELNQHLSLKKQQELLDGLSQSFGELDKDFKYTSRTRAGYEDAGPGAGNQPGKEWDPFTFHELLKAKNIWKHQLDNDMRYYWQTSLLQPVEGIDRIADVFLRQVIPGNKTVGTLVKLHHKVTEVHVNRKPGKVSVVHELVDHRDRSIGRGPEQFEADYCVSTIAPSLLHKTVNDFDDMFKQALLEGVTNVPAGKVAWQAERFWEGDKYQIYGGISWTDDAISQIWYPSNGFHNQRGILTGGYYRDAPDATIHFGDLPRDKRIEGALKQGMKLHPELGDRAVNDVSKALTIAWQNVLFRPVAGLNTPRSSEKTAIK